MIRATISKLYNKWVNLATLVIHLQDAHVVRKASSSTGHVTSKGKGNQTAARELYLVREFLQISSPMKNDNFL
jgi:hypothetical protein